MFCLVFSSYEVFQVTSGPIMDRSSWPRPCRNGSHRRYKNRLYRAGQPLGERHVESFNASLRDELLKGEILYSLSEAQIVVESWRRNYDTIRPHASLDYKPPAPKVFVPALAAWPTLN